MVTTVAPIQSDRFATDALPLPANDQIPEVLVGGLRVARHSRLELAAAMVRDCIAARRRPGTIAKTIFAANGHAVALSAIDREFRSKFSEADLVHADGQALVFASRLLTKTPIAERTATTDFIHDAALAASANGLRFFFLGATEEVNRRSAEEMKRLYPGLNIVGRRHGYFSRDEEEEICIAINQSKADVVWVGLGVPYEYEFAERNKHRLNTAWIITCGGCFNFITGDYRRAPLWMQKAGFEWLYRLMRDPVRLFWRYAVTNPVALAMLLLHTRELGPGTPARTSAADAASRKIPGSAQLRRA